MADFKFRSFTGQRGSLKFWKIQKIISTAQRFFSWEQYFTKLLIQKTEGHNLQYKKQN